MSIVAVTGRFISILMHSRTQAHVFHLRTKSFAEHKALKEYYENIVPLLDSYAETFQGKYGLISGFIVGPKIDQNPKNAKRYFKNLLKVISRVKVPDSYLANIREEIFALVYQTLYALTLNRATRVSKPALRNNRSPTNRNNLVSRYIRQMYKARE